ncbi:hypothetical protein [Pengzhenrongella phosphoraccumulans]|uniref:hypothetical protein n=1 Tax=Pengzhenrongella phosphoraccumulans TaxID=3114394 RepID=UPI00389079FA
MKRPKASLEPIAAASRKCASVLAGSLRHPVWSGLAGIATILALIFAGYSTFVDRDVPKTPANKEVWSAQMSATESEYYFDGRVEQIPNPPGFAIEKTYNHCSEWEHWLDSQTKLYRKDSRIQLNVYSVMKTQIFIDSVRVEVFSRIEMKEPFTGVTCSPPPPPAPLCAVNCPAPYVISEPGPNITVDVAKGKTYINPEAPLDEGATVTSPSLSALWEMPPAAIVMRNSDNIRATIWLTFTPGFLYTGRVVVSAVVNGHSETVTLGTADRPLRWAGSPGSTNEDFTWDVLTARWTRVSEFSDVYSTK